MEEALRAKEKSERLYEERNLVGAKYYALKAQSLCPGLDGVLQMVTTFNVYLASEARVNGEIDYYSILGLKPTDDDSKVKKQYKKMAVLLHPDKNKCVGADGAFRLLSEAWSLLSDRVKRSAYDMRRNKQVPSHTSLTGFSSAHGNGVSHFDHSYAPPVPHHRLDTFWTVCTSCKVQYEYLRKYLNKKLSCKNCRGVFMAVETAVAPVNGSYPYTWSPMPPTNGYASNGVNGVSYYPSNSVLYTGNGVHIGHGSEYSSTVSFQWSSGSKSSHGVIPNGFSTISTDAMYKTNATVKVKSKEKRKLAQMDKSSSKTAPATVTAPVQIASNSATVYRNPLLTKNGKIDKRRRVDTIAYVKSLFEDTGSNLNIPCEVKPPNGVIGATVDHISKSPILSEQQVRRHPVAIPPQLDIRKILVDKAKAQITKKLDEMRLAVEATAAAAAKKNMVQLPESVKPLELGTKSDPLSINVPDPDFHDFDKDRTEQCFQAKQIWALYDEEDGMPRLYCMIRQVISLDPFKMHITYLNSRTSSEFGSVNWVGAGFTKSCGKFKAMHSDVVDQVNIFSHVLSLEIKAGRGGCVRIYPKTGDIWAIYRNWSADWDSSTPDEVRRQYDMVEVVSDYNEGVSIRPLVKLEGYNTVYRKSQDGIDIRRVPKQEMFRFSHQVPSCLLEGVVACGLPNGCWDLDPAATPDDLLHSAKQPKSTDEHKLNLVPKVLGLHHVSEQAVVGYEGITQPGLEDVPTANIQAVQEVHCHTKAKQDEYHEKNEQAASEPLQNLNGMCHDSSLKDELVSAQRIEVECSTGIARNGAESITDLNQNSQLHHSSECGFMEPKLDFEVNLNQPQLSDEQAAVEGLQSYFDLDHNNQFQYPQIPRNAIQEPYLNPGVRQNQYSYTSDHADLAPGPYSTMKPGQHHAGNQHGLVDEPNIVFKQENLHWALQPPTDREQTQLSEAEQIELLSRF